MYFTVTIGLLFRILAFNVKIMYICTLRFHMGQKELLYRPVLVPKARHLFTALPFAWLEYIVGVPDKAPGAVSLR